MSTMRAPAAWWSVVFTLVVCTACSDKISSFYPSYEDMARDGAIDRGWIPRWLPRGIHDIYELDNLDSNQTWCRFDFTDADAVVLQNHLKPVEGEWRTSVRNPGVEWWSAALRGRPDPGALRREGLELYRHESSLFAINWRERRAFLYVGGS